jgi:phosphonate ABC transporter substrate-binding protein
VRGLIGTARTTRHAVSLRALAVLALLAAPLSAAEPPVMLVYLPSVSNQNPREVAAAVTSLAAELGPTLPGPPLEVSFFRRPEDALAFVSAHRARVAFVLCDAAFLLDLAPDLDLEPLFRFTSSGSERERKLLVVKSSGAKRLADLRGKTLAAVPVPSKSLPAYLGRVFDDLLPPGWFGKIEPAQDDFAATASVLYGGADAALVSEQNPLAAGKLGSELRAVYTSAPLSLPVLGARRALVTPKLEEALARVVSGLSSRSEGRSILTGLRIEGLRPIADAGDRNALAKPASRRPRTYEIALPDISAVPVPQAPAPAAKDLPFVVELEIPEVPIAQGAAK